MQKVELTRDVCEAYCSFYKSGKDEDLACKGLIVLQKLLELRDDIPEAGRKEHPAPETEVGLFEKLCSNCPFVASDCDFAAWKRGEKGELSRDSVSPCGGFIFIGACIDHGTLDLKELDRVI